MDNNSSTPDRVQLAPAVSRSYESHPHLMNFCALQKLHEKVFAFSASPALGPYSPQSNSARLNDLALPFGDVDLGDSSSDSSPNSPEFDERQLDSDSSDGRSSSGLRTPERSPLAKRSSAAQARGGWSSTSSDVSSTEGGSCSSFGASPRSQSTLLPATPSALALEPKSQSTPPPKKKSVTGPGFGVRHPSGVPLSATSTSLPKPRLKTSATARSAPSQTEREVEESRRGRNRWPRILWRSEIDSSSLDVLEQYHTRAVGEPLPQLDVRMNAAAVGDWSRKLEKAGL